MKLQDIIGQPKALTFLGRALQSGRLAHAYLLNGPDGVGKKTTAMALAARMFCQSPGGMDACGICNACQKFASGNHPDFLPVSPDGAAIKIKQIRDLKKNLSFPPFEAKQRVVLLDEVQTMRREAANSLLKVLEEPPPDNLLLLVASDSEPLLPTIISRCQLVPFYPLSRDLTADILQKNDPGLDRKNALVLAGLADGAPGSASTMESSGILEVRNNLLQEILEPPPTEAKCVEKALLLAEKTLELKDKMQYFFDLLRVFFKDALIASLSEEKDGKDHFETDIEINLARERWNLQQLSDNVEAVEYAQRALKRNCNRALVCEVLFLKLMGTTS